MKRRDFLSLTMGAAVAFARDARAQTAPVVGWLNLAANNNKSPFAQAFFDALKDEGFAEGVNLRRDERYADGNSERLPALAANLVARRVSLIAALGSASAPLAAKAATSTIPIVFAVGTDPVQLGLVPTLNRPGGNLTGITFRIVTLLAKRIELMRDLVPNAKSFAVFIDPSLVSTEVEAAQVEATGRRLGVTLLVIKATNVDEMTAHFPALAAEKVGGVVVGNGPSLNDHAEQTAVAAARFALPTITDQREFAVAGGLVGYGANFVAGFRACGHYAARILKGEKPGDLPVEEMDQFDLVINLKTAKTLGLAIPPMVLVQATEVIE